jgi:nucleoid-associated protein YgaU
MVSRYDNRKTGINDDEKYENKFEKRNTVSIQQFLTPKLKHPTVDQIANLTTVEVVWIEGDRYWKLASQYYNDPKMWWVIAWFNKAPTEQHLSIGDMVVIPLPLTKILDYFGY